MAQQTKTRRILYNDDGGAVKHMKTPEVDAMLAKRIKPLVGTHVDTVFYCGHDDFTRTFYPSSLDGVEISGGDGLRQALNSGIDPNQELVRFCRDNGLEIFWSIRMNDIHDSYGGGLGKFKRDHPEWLFGSKDVKYPDRSVKAGIWSSLDYEQPQVRDHIFAFIEEVCQRYDLDGLEFDYGRNASLFRPTFEGRHVEQKHLDILTAFQRRLRTLAEQIGRQRGRPLLLTASVPENIEFCRLVGIDIETWLAEDLLDFLVAGNGYVPFSMATRELIELGHKQGIQVYPRLDLNTGDRLFWRHTEPWRAAAVNIWHCGGDGVYLFNAYDVGDKWNKPHASSLLVEMGEPESLQGTDKLYAVDVDLRTTGYGCADICYYMPRDHLVPISLAKLNDFVQFYVGEDFSAARAKGLQPRLELQIRLDGLADGSAVPPLTLNGRALSDGSERSGEDDQRWVVYVLEPEQILLGDNKIVAIRSDDLPQSSATLARVMLWVRY